MVNEETFAQAKCRINTSEVLNRKSRQLRIKYLQLTTAATAVFDAMSYQKYVSAVTPLAIAQNKRLAESMEWLVATNSEGWPVCRDWPNTGRFNRLDNFQRTFFLYHAGDQTSPSIFQWDLSGIKLHEVDRYGGHHYYCR